MPSLVELQMDPVKWHRLEAKCVAVAIEVASRTVVHPACFTVTFDSLIGYLIFTITGKHHGVEASVSVTNLIEEDDPIYIVRQFIESTWESFSKERYISSCWKFVPGRLVPPKRR